MRSHSERLYKNSLVAEWTGGRFQPALIRLVTRVQIPPPLLFFTTFIYKNLGSVAERPKAQSC